MVRVISQGLVDIGKFEDLSKITKELPEIFANITKEKISEFKDEKKSLKDFKESFSTFANSLTHGSKGQFMPPLIVFVDELDRCKPTYAVELLETMKHFFNVQWVVFVLGIDRKQLSHSVRCLYGNEMDADGYLKRFINHEFTLPNPPRRKYCEFLYDYFKMEEVFPVETPDMALVNIEQKIRSGAFLESKQWRCFRIFFDCISRGKDESIQHKIDNISKEISPTSDQALREEKRWEGRVYGEFVNITQIRHFLFSKIEFSENIN